jgi:broad specificity phosphatase PhoE
MEGAPNTKDKEALNKPLFKVTLMRHEEPLYKDEGHDLTPRGVENAKARGAEFKDSGHFSAGDELHLYHSPKARAKGTLEFVAEGAGISHESKRSIDQIRSSDLPDLDAFMERVAELNNEPEALAKDHHTNPDLYENNPQFIEPHSKKRKRLYRAFEYLIRAFEKKPQENASTPHVLAVSHFEIITHLIDDVFGIETMGKYHVPGFGESVTIEAYPTEDKDRLRLKVMFNDHSKEVYFDRNNRSIEIS